MSIASEIQRLQTLKTNIRSALVYKGIEVASAHDMEDFEADILAIETSPYAAIGVTYPSGSTCTCSNGTKTLTAKDTSGVMLFSIPSTGTWTVRITNGSQSESTSVAITSYGQAQTVSLSYSLNIYLNGVVETAISGGVVANIISSIDTSGSCSVSNDGTNLNCYGQYNSGNKASNFYFGTNNAVDISAYSTLTVVFSSVANTMDDVYLLVTDRKAQNYAYTPADYRNYSRTSVTVAKNTWASQTKSLDVSSITGWYYLGICAMWGASPRSGTIQIRSMVLTK